MPYTPEYDVMNRNALNAQEIAKAGGGRVITNAEEVFSGELEEVAGIKDISSMLILLSIFLLLADIAARRFGVDMSKVSGRLVKTAKAFSYIRKNSASKKADSGAYVSSQLLAKKRRWNGKG